MRKSRTRRSVSRPAQDCVTRPLAPGYRKTTLENGIRVVTETIPTVRSLALGILVEANPQQETPEQRGLAHLTEHMLFQGTSNRDVGQIARVMDLVGGQVGGFTGRDYTCYFAHVLDEHYTYALDLFGDVFLNSTFPEERLERERTAILCEMEAAADSPGDRSQALLKETMWAEHPLGQPITGTAESVARLSREDVIYFFHKNYVPDRIILAAAGNVDHEDFVAHVRDAFWRMLGQADPVLPRTPQPRPGVVVQTAGVSQAYFSLGLPAMPYAHADRYRMHVLNDILGGGSSSRLFRRLREAYGLVYDVGSEYHAYREAGMLVVEGSTVPEKLTAVVGNILQLFMQLASGEEPISEEELWKSVGKLRRQHLLSSESGQTRMSRLATQAFYFDQFISDEVVLAEIEAVDAAGLHELAETVLGLGLSQAALAVVGPEGQDSCPQEELERLLGAFRLDGTA